MKALLVAAFFLSFTSAVNAQSADKLEMRNWLTDLETTGRLWFKGDLVGNVARPRLMKKVADLSNLTVAEGPLQAAKTTCISAGSSLAGAMGGDPRAGDEYKRFVAECRKHINRSK